MKLFTILSSLVILSSCAHIVIPEGGGKDTSPPIIQKYSPPNGSNNLFPDQIVITFDENVQISNINENVSITPDINANPKIKAVKKKIYVDIPKDSLQANTTYTINFGNSLSDINESNILKSFNYQFSTGEQRDTLYVGGHVVDVKENNPIEKCLVLLTKTNTRLTYTSNTDALGNWKILNVAKGNYQLLIYSDKNSNKRLDEEEIYYFENLTIDSIIPKKVFKLITFYSPKQGKIIIDKAKYLNDYSIFIKLNQGTDSSSKIMYSLSNINNKKNLPVSSTNLRDSLIIYHPFIENDTIQLNIQSDTLQRFTIIQPKKRTKEKLKISTILTIIRQEDPINFISSIPIQYINSEKITINENFKPTDSKKESDYKFSLKHNLKTNLKVIFAKGAVSDLNGEDNQIDTFLFQIAEDEQSGNFEFIVKDTSSIEMEQIIVKIFNTTTQYHYKTTLNKVNKIKALLPGTYSLEMWQDKNNNGIWDMGNYYNATQPEKILLKKDFVLIKPNWDTIGVEIYMD